MSTKAPEMLLRALECEVRSVDKEKRTASFVASTERAVATWAGPEVLRMSGAKLQRFRKNPVVLDTHDRYGVNSIVGRADVRVDKEGRQLLADVEFAKNERGEAAWQLVRDGFLRAVSIGYMPNRKRTVQLKEGESDGEGEARVTGPAFVVKDWELIELSMVPVPADEDALRRAFYTFTPRGEVPMEFTDVMAERQAGTAAPQPGAPAPKPVQAESQEERDARAEIARQRVLEAKRAQILAITPASLRDLGEQLALQGVSLEDARKRLLEESTKTKQPLGTPEPPAERAAEKPKDLLPVEAIRSALFGGE